MNDIARQLDDLNDLLYIAIPTLIGAVGWGPTGIGFGLFVGLIVNIIRDLVNQSVVEEETK